MNVVVDHVTKTIHGAVVLQDISLNFESGKVYGLQGENGSGKTMLLRLMCGLIYATEGSVSVNDRRLGKDLDFPESVGVMIESPAFIDEYTGQKNLELLAGLKQLISVSDIHNTLQAVGLDPNDKRTFKKYSLGMKQRLGIAAALMEKPDLLILDEPTNGLDPSGIHEIRNLVKSLPSLYDCTVLISSHMLSEIELIADDIGILNHGRLLFEGSMNDLRSGFAADNLEDVFLSMVEKDNMDRKQRAKL